MLEIFFKIVDVTLPVFGLIGLGVALAWFKFINHSANESLKAIVFNVFIPVMIFTQMAKASSENIFNYSYILLVVILAFIIFGFTVLVGHKYFPKNNKNSALHGLSSSLSNSTYIGLPICWLAFGDAGMIPAIIFTSVLMIATTLSTVVLCSIDDIQGYKYKKKWTTIGKMISSVFLNPIVISPVLGAIWSFSGIALPQVIDITFTMIFNANIVIALMIIGSSLYLIIVVNHEDTDSRFWQEIASINFVKLLIMPVLAWLIIMPFDFDPVWKAVFVLQSAMPSSLLTYLMAINEKTFIKRSAINLLVSTTISVITLPIIIGILWSSM